MCKKNADNKILRIGIAMCPQMPFPCIKGGAVETLMQFILDENEKTGKFHFIFFVADYQEIQPILKRYKNSEFIICKNNFFSRFKYFLSRVVFHFLKMRFLFLDDFHHSVYNYVKKNHLDAVIAEGGSQIVEFKKISKIIGKDKMIIHLHAVFEGSKQADEIFGKAICISKYVENQWKKNSNTETVVVKNCINHRKFTNKNHDNVRELRKKLDIHIDDFVLIYCGRFIAEKGVLELFNTLSTLSDIKLIAIGSTKFGMADCSKYEKKLYDIAKKNTNIKMIGYVANDNLADYYAIATLAVVPSLCQEGAGLVAIEAMASGKPVLATLSGGMPEYLPADGTLFVSCNKETVCKEFIQKINYLKENISVLERMGKINFEAAKAYTPENYYQNFTAAIINLIKKD